MLNRAFWLHTKARYGKKVRPGTGEKMENLMVFLPGPGTFDGGTPSPGLGTTGLRDSPRHAKTPAAGENAVLQSSRQSIQYLRAYEFLKGLLAAEPNAHTFLDDLPVTHHLMSINDVPMVTACALGLIDAEVTQLPFQGSCRAPCSTLR